MIKLLLSGFLSISCISNAATVQPDNQTDSPILFVNKNTTSSAQFQTVNDLEKVMQTPDQSEKYTQHLGPTKQTQEAFFITTPTTQRKKQSGPKLAEFAKKLKSEYEDNELVQQSLSTFYEAKQLWNNADSQANAFAADMIQNLNLDNLLQDDLSNTLHSTQNPSISFFLKKNINFSRQSRSEKNITFNQIRQTRANTAPQGISTLNNHFIAKLFRMSTVYYIVSIFVLFSLIQWAIKFSLRFFP